MFHSPYCFLSKLTIQNPICKRVPIFSLSLLFSFKKLFKTSFAKSPLRGFFLLQYLSNFHADQYYPAPYKKAGVGNSSVHPDLLPHTGFLLISDFQIFSNF